MTKRQLIAALREAGISFPSKASKAELQDLYNEQRYGETQEEREHYEARSAEDAAPAEKLEAAEAIEADARTDQQYEVGGLPVEEVPDPGPAKKKATKKRVAKKVQKPGAKQVLREKFEKDGEVTQASIDKIVKRLGCSRSTVQTAISDLKNARYAGKSGPLAIVKDGDTYRLEG